jgi:hypothetical protein
MAVKDFTYSKDVGEDRYGSWAAGTDGDTGQPIEIHGQRGIVAAVQMFGTFGGSVSIQKSLNGSNWITATDFDGSDVTLSAAGIVEFSTAARWLRAFYGAGVSSVTVLISLRG